MIAMKMVTSRNANGATTHFFFFVTCWECEGRDISFGSNALLRAFQHFRISDVSQIAQVRPLRNRSAQTSGLVDCDDHYSRKERIAEMSPLPNAQSI